MNPQNQHRQVRDSGLKYLPDIGLVEQVLPDGTRLFPHTEQLPVISKAVDREFFEALPDRLARTDHRGDHRRKYILHNMATRFCDFKNDLRDDRLILCPILRRDLVSRVAVVQHETFSTDKGKWHRFRFFADGAFHPDPLFFGKPFVFSSHVLDRYRERVAKNAGMPYSSFLIWTVMNFGMPMRTNNHEGYAILFDHPKNTLIALTLDPCLWNGHRVFTTCLTPNEITTLEPLEKSHLMFFHFHQPPPQKFTLQIRYDDMPARMIATWKKQEQPLLENAMREGVPDRYKTWHFLAHHAWHDGATFKFPDGCRFAFLGNFHSTCQIRIPPQCPEPLPLIDGPDEKPLPPAPPEPAPAAQPPPPVPAEIPA